MDIPMEEESCSWENWHLHTEMDCENDDDEFLRDILQQPPPTPPPPLSSDAALGNSKVSENESKTPRRFILSFDSSTVVPATPEPSSNNSSTLPAKRALGPGARTRPIQGAHKKVRTSSQTVDHIMAERRRRQELTERFIALSATIPGLNKTDKASVLRAAIEYVKELKEQVEKHEKQDKTSDVVKKLDPSTLVPEIEARVLGKEVLIEIHCDKQNGVELKLLDHLENLHLSVTGSSVLPFGNSALCITVTAKMGEEYQMRVDDLVENIGQVLSKSHVLGDPY